MLKHVQAFLPILFALAIPLPGQAGEAPGMVAVEQARIEALILQLRSERFEEREAAQAELRKAGPAAQPALKRLRVSGDPELARRVKELLQGEEGELESLIAQFKREPGPARVELLARIVKADGDRSRPFLLSLLTSEQDTPLIEQALWQLSKSGGGDAEGKVVQAFYNRCDEGLKDHALFALSRLDPEAARPLIREALKSEDADLKYCAVRCLIWIHDRDSAPALREIAGGGENVSSELQTSAIYALVSMRDEALKDILPPLLKSEDLDVFQAALHGVGWLSLKSPEISKIVQALYNDPKRAEGRCIIMRTMGQTGDPSFIPILIDALSRDRDLRYSALDALADMRAKEAVPRIATFLSDPDSRMRGMACSALGQFGYCEAIPALKDLLTDRVDYVCLAAAAALLNLGDRSGEDRMVELARQHALRDGFGAVDTMRLLVKYRIEKGIPMLKKLVVGGHRLAVWPLVELSPDRESSRLALSLLLKSRKDDPKIGRDDMSLAKFYLLIHYYDRAAKILENMAQQELHYSYGSVHGRLAMVYQESGRYAEAEAAYARWGRMEPENCDPPRRLAWFYCTAYDREYIRPEQAVALARRAVEQDPESHSDAKIYGWALYAAGRHEEALKELNRALSLIEPADRKNQADIRSRTARVLAKLGRKDEALGEFRTALAGDSRNGELWFSATGFYAALGKRDEAIDAVHRAVNLGYRNVAGFKLNAEFDALREDAGFQYAVRRAEEELREFDRIVEEAEKEARTAAPASGPGRVPIIRR